MANVRRATLEDRPSISALYLSAFPENERERVARLAADLLAEDTAPETVSLIAEIDSVCAGHIALSPVSIEGDPDWCGYILAPLAVAPAQQGNGVGSALVDTGLAQLAQSGASTVLVYGDPKFYSRFGFSAEAAESFLPPHKLEYPFGWQALVLDEPGSRSGPARISCVASLTDKALW